MSRHDYDFVEPGKPELLDYGEEPPRKRKRYQKSPVGPDCKSDEVPLDPSSASIRPNQAPTPHHANTMGPLISGRPIASPTRLLNVQAAEYSDIETPPTFPRFGIQSVDPQTNVPNALPAKPGVTTFAKAMNKLDIQPAASVAPIITINATVPTTPSKPSLPSWVHANVPKINRDQLRRGDVILSRTCELSYDRSSALNGVSRFYTDDGPTCNRWRLMIIIKAGYNAMVYDITSKGNTGVQNVKFNMIHGFVGVRLMEDESYVNVLNHDPVVLTSRYLNTLMVTSVVHVFDTKAFCSLAIPDHDVYHVGYIDNNSFQWLSDVYDAIYDEKIPWVINSPRDARTVRRFFERVDDRHWYRNERQNDKQWPDFAKWSPVPP